MAKDLGKKNLDIWKDTTLFDVTEESNLRIIVSPHQEKETQREFEKHNVETCLMNFPKEYYITKCERWRIFPQVEDDMTIQRLENKKPTTNG